MADKPKLTGLSFNIYAIVGLLVILPISTAFVTNLGYASNNEYQSVNRLTEPDEGCDYGFAGTELISWTDKGANVTDLYLNQNPQSSTIDYESIYDESYPILGSLDVRSCSYLNSRFSRNNDVFFFGHDNHNSLSQSNIQNYQGYIGYSGNEFGFKVHSDWMKYIPNDQDLKSLKFTFLDYRNSFNCESNIFQNLNYKSDISFNHNYLSSNYKINGFEFDRSNKYEVNYLPQGQTQQYANGSDQQFGNTCHIQFVLEYEFTPFEAIEFEEIFNKDYQNLSLNIKIYDIQGSYSNQYLEEGGVSIYNQNSNEISYPLAFEGDSFHGVLFEFNTVDNSQVNLWLKGGTLLIGVALFALALASTPYWNPVTNALKPKGGM